MLFPNMQFTREDDHYVSHSRTADDGCMYPPYSMQPPQSDLAYVPTCLMVLSCRVYRDDDDGL